MFYATKEITFCAGHRLSYGYHGKCQNLHGHNYKLSITIGSQSLNTYGFVLDFSQIKTLCQSWIDEYLDHACIVTTEDTSLLEFLKTHDQKHYLLPSKINSTVEELAKHLFHIFQEFFKHADPSLQLSHIKLHETDSSYATYSEEEPGFPLSRE